MLKLLVICRAGCSVRLCTSPGLKTVLEIFEENQDIFEANQSGLASILRREFVATTKKERRKMSWSRLYYYSIASTLTFVIILLAAGPGNAQTKQSPPPFRAGQSMYIVAFRLIQFPIILDE